MFPELLIKKYKKKYSKKSFQLKNTKKKIFPSLFNFSTSPILQQKGGKQFVVLIPVLLQVCSLILLLLLPDIKY